MTVRLATETDAGQVLSLIRELAEFEELSEHVVCSTADLRGAMSGPAPVVRVTLAVADRDEVAGMALWFPSFSTFLGRSGIWLEDLFVRDGHRRHGHARDLMADLRRRCDGRVEWEVLDWNRQAMRFYDRLGARPVTGWTKYRWL